MPFRGGSGGGGTVVSVNGVEQATLDFDDELDGEVDRAHLAATARGGGWSGIIWTMPRASAIQTPTNPLQSGTLILMGGEHCVLPRGVAINTIKWVSSSTAAVSPTNQWACLVERDTLAVLAKTADKTTEAWGANAVKTFTFSSAYTPAADTPVYIGLVVVASTIPTLAGLSTPTHVTGDTPILGGRSTGSLTNPASLGATAAAIGTPTAMAYASAA